MRKLTIILLAGAVLAMLLAVGVHAAAISDVRITPVPEGADEDAPGEATSNSIFTLEFHWKENTAGKLPEPGTLMVGTYVPYEGFTWYILPEDAGKGSPSAPEGRLYTFRMTAGLNLRATNPLVPVAPRQPDPYHPLPPALIYNATVNTDHPIPDLRDVYYMPGLVAKVPLLPPIKIYVRGVFKADPEEGSEEEPEPQVVGPEDCEVIVHDSHNQPNRWAGQDWDRDYLYGYAAYPDGFPSPVQTFGLNENFQWREPDDASYPDDGTTSTCWEFRVVYRNSDNLPPIPYLSYFGGQLGDDYLPWHWYNNEPDSTGVVLYIKNKSWAADADFVAVPMRKVDPNNNNYAAGVEYFYILEPAWWNDYVGLPIGEYEFFFGCSDDYIRDSLGGIPSWLDHELSFDYSTTPATVTMLPKRAVTMPLNRSHHPTYPSYMSAYNNDLYLDRPTLQPGVTNSYGLSATGHPVIPIGLRNPSPLDSPWEATVSPLYKIVNPQTGAIQCGGAQNQKWDFPIMYQHLYGILPEGSQGSGYEISVWINDSNAIVPDPARPDTQYRRYTLVLKKDTPTSPAPTADEIKNGVIYHLPNPIELKPGPHSYFFTASDGQKRVRFPVDGHGHYFTGSHAFDGPYVNHKPVLESPMVDPPTGTAGDKFRYSVTYKDADNQRPYTARIYIEYDTGMIVEGEMVKANPADNDYDGVGVRYVFDTANMAQQFRTGQRRYYFAFTDDWGAVNDPRDRRRGETVYFNSAQPGSWIYGPYINSNTIPQLLDGGVQATDTAGNSATIFEYKVKYVDADNHAPKYIDVYIGQVQSDGSILWDSGHDMQQIDPADTVYSGDGAWFRYTSQLTGDTDNPRNYYYCFVASDRYDVAEYDPVKSPSAGTVWFTRDASGQPLHQGERLDNTTPGNPMLSTFQATKHPLVGPIPSAPTGNPYTSPSLYATSGASLDSTVDYLLGTFTTAVGVAQADAQYWFASPGPLNVVGNTPPSLVNGSVSPDPGESTQEYTYRVTYKDQDGLMGQPPYYIRVRIDGVPYDMARTSAGEPNYKVGVTYTYRTTSLSPQLPHHYYFEASDGSGYAVWDKNGGRSSDVEIGAVTWIPGPYVNNKPALTAPTSGAVYPTPGAPISEAQWLNFGIIYTDANNEWPSSPTPTLFIRRVAVGQPAPPTPPEPANDFKVESIATSGSGCTITVLNLDGTTAPAWTPDEFKGLPLQITSGSSTGTCYRVTGNTANTISVFASSLPGVLANNTFSIGKIQLNRDAADNNCADGAEYTYRLNSLGEGEYALHFRTSTEETTGENGIKRTTVLRYPQVGEITGLKIIATSNPGNLAPVLAKGLTSDLVSPQIGLSGAPFTFKITYSDANGDEPKFRPEEFVTGYVRLVVDGVLPGYDMNVQALPNYVTGAEFTYNLASGALEAREHSFYFTASDGWQVTRYPALGQPDLKFNINRKPTLQNAAVTPLYGNAGIDYEYSVIYKDLDNRPPDATLGYVKAVINGAERAMTVDTSAGTDYAGVGVRYKVVVPGSDLIEGADGANSFYAKANDGLESADDTAAIAKPWVHANNAPQLINPSLTPADHQWTDSNYEYKVTYLDTDGDPPAFVKLDIYINGVGAPLTFDMVKAFGQNDYSTGVQYSYGKSGLPVGNHTYVFRADDHDLPAADLLRNGPNVQNRPAAALVVDQPATMPRIGQSTTITGTITPARAVTLTLTFKRPNDTQYSVAVTTDTNGTFRKAWTPDMTGMLPNPWQVKASYAGDDTLAAAESAWTSIQVSGPSTTVRGLDMISVPLSLANSDPSIVFGDGTYALAQYRPSIADYAYYRSTPGLPGDPELPLSDITLGAGYWIKVYNDQTLTVAPSGNLASTGTYQVIPLNRGWNQVGCPFNGNVNWNTIKVRRGTETVDIAVAATKGWIRSYAWAFQQSTTNPYTGEYKLVDPTKNGALYQIAPWRGYWVKALVDCSLVVPPPGTMNMDANAGLTVTTGDDPDWQVRLSASVAGKSDTDNALGSASSAAKIESPGYLDSFVDLYFTDDKAGIYAYDIRSKAKAGEKWTFRVSTDQTDGLVEVAWTGIETLPIGTALTLVDEATGKSVVMKAGSVYTFPAAEAAGGRQFRVTLGK